MADSDVVTSYPWRPGLLGPGNERTLGFGVTNAPFRARESPTLTPHPGAPPTFSFVYEIMPNADHKDAWTETGGPTFAWDCLNDRSRTEYITTTTIDAICRVDYETLTLRTDEVVACIVVEVDLLAFGGSIQLGVLIDGTVTVRTVTIPNTTDGVYNFVVTAPFTQAQLDSIRFQAVHKSGGTSFVYSAPMKVYTRTDVWESVNSKMRANRHTSTGLSIAAGYMGSDLCPSVDLGGGRSWLSGGDAGFTDAGGKQFWFGENASTPGAGRANFVRNHGLLLDSYNLEAANFTYWTGASLTPYYPDDATYGGRWPFKHLVHDGRLITVGRYPDYPNLAWVAYCDDFSGAPNTWVWTFLPAVTGFAIDRANAEFGYWDDGAGKIYIWNAGPGSTSPWRFSMCRLDADSFHEIRWTQPEWFTGTGWSRDRHGSATSLPPAVRGRRRLRARLDPEPPELLTNQGGVDRRPDGRFQLSVMDASPAHGGGPPPYTLRYALTPGTVPGIFQPGLSTFIVPEGEPFVYAPSYHPHLTWPGMGESDQVWSYASNWGDSFRQWEPLYFSRFVKARLVTGI